LCYRVCCGRESPPTFVKKAEDHLLRRLSGLPGFNGYYLIEAGIGVISSVGFCDTAEHGEESTRVASNWVREESRERRCRIHRRSSAGR
jgi:hypothetical protein